MRVGSQGGRGEAEGEAGEVVNQVIRLDARRAGYILRSA